MADTAKPLSEKPEAVFCCPFAWMCYNFRMDSKKIEFVSSLVILAGVLFLVFLVFRPFLPILVLSAVLSVLFQPVYKKLLRIFGGGKSFWAAVIVLLTLVFLIIPVLFFGSQILGQAQNFFSMSQGGQSQYIQNIGQSVQHFVQHVFPNFSFNISDYASKAVDFISQNLGGFISGAAGIFFQIVFLLFAFFYFLRDGETILDSFMSLSPFSKEQNKEIIDSTYNTITSVIRGTLFVGLVRWALLMAGFYLFQIPNPLFWGSIGAVVGAIPGVGTPFAVIPAVIYLLIKGKILFAVMTGLYGILIIFFIDNILSAYLFGKGLQAPAVFVLFSILGGIFAFGPLGFIFGPIILSLFISALEIYKILILKKYE
jgi:predicted PurR-regulated permease PerM